MSDETIQQEQVPAPLESMTPEQIDAALLQAQALLAAVPDAVAETEKGSQTIAEIAEQLVPESKPEPEVEETQIVEVVSVGSLPGFWNVHVRYVNDAGGVSDVALRFGPSASHSVLPLWKAKTDFVAARKDDYKGILLVPCPEIVSV